MVYPVVKTIRGKRYLYLQRCDYEKKTGKRKVKCVKYLGREDKYTEKQVERIINGYKRGRKDENKRAKRRARKR